MHGDHKCHECCIRTAEHVVKHFKFLQQELRGKNYWLFFINIRLVGCRLKMLRNCSNMMIYGGRAVQDVIYTISKHFSLSTIIYDSAITHRAGAHRGQHVQLISEMWAGLWQSWQNVDKK